MVRQVLFKETLSICTIGNMASELISALHCGEDVTIDLSGVDRMDSAALQVLVAAAKEADSKGIRLKFTLPDTLKTYASSVGVEL